ncbi:hypothetical protein N7G274_006464 [Stereocaulon virgatum]|uniref:Cytochrome P450 n=1 Tax=Stereocaulon virgatum TaxID=373712 RepID=A0ABR4A6J9_9LECA
MIDFEPFVLSSLSSDIAVIFLISIVLYGSGLAVYRLLFSPIAGFPGPKIAAITSWYEFYYDYFRSGTYIFRIEEMHREYGPIIRINPQELSVHDPAFYNDIYVTESTRRTENYNHFVKGIDFDGSHFLTTPHDLHRRRRKPLEPFFSRLGIIRLEPMLADVVGKLNNRLEALKGSNTVVRLDHAFFAFSGDVIGRICCEERVDFLDDPDFAPQWFDLIHAVIKSVPLFTGMPFLVGIVGLIPEAVLSWVDPRSQKFNDFKKMANKHIVDAKRDKLNPAGKVTDKGSRRSLFRHIVNSDMPESELSTERLSKEAQVLLGAGTASTARTLDFLSYHILSKIHIRQRLMEELTGIMAEYPQSVPSLTQLEKLPYLQAVIKEGLRLSIGVMHRLPRCSPDVPIQYKRWTIPRGVPVGMSSYFMHLDPTVYPKPFEFLPERWLGDADPLMSRNLVPFSRGSRACLGMNLAQAELNVVLAILYRPDGPAFDLFDTNESDVIPVHDFLIPLPKLETKGVRVLIS